MARSRTYRNGSEYYTRIAKRYDIPNVSNPRKLFLSLSVKYNDVLQLVDDYFQWNTRQDYNEIIPRFNLGRMPVKGGFPLPPDLGMVVSVVAYQEIAGKGLMINNVYKPEDWKDLGIEHLHVNMEDLTADVESEDMLLAIEKIKRFLDQHPDISVYVHCKAGRSRSVMLAATYLAIYGHRELFPLTNDPEDNFRRAVDFIKHKRPHIDVGPNKTAKAVSTLFFAAEKKTQIDDVPMLETPTLSQYICSLEAKDAISQMTAFKSLAEYATEKQYFVFSCHRTEHIRDFFRDILHSSNDGWYNRLLKKEGPIKKLLDAVPQVTAQAGHEDKERREKLVRDFTEELQQLLREKHLLPLERMASPSNSS